MVTISALLVLSVFVFMLPVYTEIPAAAILSAPAGDVPKTTVFAYKHALHTLYPRGDFYSGEASRSDKSEINRIRFITRILWRLAAITRHTTDFVPFIYQFIYRVCYNAVDKIRRGVVFVKEYAKLVESLIQYSSEKEWLEFKENWFEAYALGEYISAISNAAAVYGRDAGYFIWGISDKTHEIVGTTFDYQQDYKNEPLQHYLARQTAPDIGFAFHEAEIRNKRIVILEIPAAAKIPTSFDKERYIRIGSSKENVRRFPEREAQLFDVLKNGLPSLENTESDYQDLRFERVFTYYAGRGISLKQETFRKNLGLLTPGGKYNLLAQLLSDDCHMPIRVSVFRGKSKAAPLYSVKEFGNTCILSAMDKILDYGDVINLVQADERNRGMIRRDITLFDTAAFREALINAFVHNKWVDGNAPMFTVYSDRIEILSRGSLAPKQTLEGFFLGESVPVNRKLSDVFLQLHISERSGRGIPKITEVYGPNVFEFRENSIVVTLPFRFVDAAPADQTVIPTDKPLPVPERILLEIRNNPNVTQPQLAVLLGIGKTSVQNGISALKKSGRIERIGSNKTGYWKVVE